MFSLSQKSLDRLVGVHPDLVHVVFEAIKISKVDFVVTEGRRSAKRQAELVRAGASQTMNSYHLTGHAVDVAALVNGKVSWEWPLYVEISKAFKKVAAALGVEMVWGGDWKSLRDGPHYQITRK